MEEILDKKAFLREVEEEDRPFVKRIAPSLPPFGPKQRTPQVPFGMYFSASAWYLLSARPAYSTHATFGWFFRNSATFSAFLQ